MIGRGRGHLLRPHLTIIEPCTLVLADVGWYSGFSLFQEIRFLFLPVYLLFYTSVLCRSTYIPLDECHELVIN